MIVTANVDGSHTVQINDAGPDNCITLNIPAGTTAHVAWQQLLSFCAANNVFIIPQMVLINPSGTTGTLLS